MSIYDKITQSKFYSLGDKLSDLMMISLLWLLFSLPIVTLGASTAALYYATTQRFYRESQTPRQDFMRSFRMNLRQGILITLIYLVYGGIIAFDIYVARNGINGHDLPGFYEPIAYVLLFPIVFSLPYVFAYLSRFSNTIRTTLKHSFVFSVMHPLHAIGLLFIAAGCAAFMVLFFPSVLLVPIGGAYLCSKWIERDFNLRLRPDEDHSDKVSAEEKFSESKEA